MKKLTLIAQAAVAATLALGTVACAHQGTLRPEALAASTGEIRAAEEAGADRVPKAALHLKLAREQIEAAKLFARDGDEQRADMVLMRAKADARLALMLAQEESVKQQAQVALTEVQKIQNSPESRSLDEQLKTN